MLCQSQKTFFLLAAVLFLVPISYAQDFSSMSDADFTARLEKVADSLSGKHENGIIQLYIPRAEAEMDLAILKRVLEEAQTTLYRYTDRKSLDLVFSEAIPADADFVSYFTLIRTLARIQNAVACGHSGWGHSKAFKRYRKKSLRLFPLDLTMKDGRFVILRNNSDHPDIPDHSRLVSINGVSLYGLSERLHSYMYRDGLSADRSFRDILMYFTNAYSNFIDNPKVFKIEIVAPMARVPQTIELEGLLKSKIDSNRTARYGSPESKGLPLQFSFADKADAAVYSIQSFNKEYMAHFGQEFEHFTDSIFSVMETRKTENLIIDLRGNFGGWTAHGRYLFSYFIDQETPYMRRVVTKKHDNYSFAPIVNSMPGYMDTFDLQLKDYGVYDWTNYPSLQAIPQPENRFKGKVYVLTDNHSRSCSAVFSSLMREHTQAIFVGEEPGGARCGSGGMVMGIRLPYSGVFYHFSTARYDCAIPNAGESRGVVPDITVHPNPFKLSQGEDPVMELTMEMILNEGIEMEDGD